MWKIEKLITHNLSVFVKHFPVFMSHLIFQVWFFFKRAIPSSLTSSAYFWNWRNSHLEVKSNAFDGVKNLFLLSILRFIKYLWIEKRLIFLTYARSLLHCIIINITVKHGVMRPVHARKLDTIVLPNHHNPVKFWHGLL